MTEHRPDNAASSDDVLSREIERLLAVEHSPAFRARVRSGLTRAHQFDRHRWRWMVVTAVAGAAVVVGVLLTRSQPGGPSVDRPLSRRASSADSVVPEASAVARRAAEPEQAPAGSSRSRRSVRGTRVLVAPDEARAIRAVLAAVSSRRVDPGMFPTMPDAPLPIEIPDPVEIRALPELSVIAIRPLSFQTGREGVDQ